MPLFKTTVDMQLYLRMTITFEFDDIKPYLELAQVDFLSRYLGVTLANDLDAWYNTVPTPPTNAAYTAILKYAQGAVANWGIKLASPDLDLNLTGAGFAVTQNPQHVPASKDRVAKFDSNREYLAYMWIEQLLKYLEENKVNYPTWVSSSAYTLVKDVFINSATVFDKYVNIEQSRLTFMKWMQTMIDIELQIVEPKLSKTQCDLFKTEIASGTIPAATAAVLDKIRRAIAYMTAGKMQEKESLYLSGISFLEQVQIYMDANISDYALYSASESYISDRTSRTLFENTEENKVFVFGFGSKR